MAFWYSVRFSRRNVSRAAGIRMRRGRAVERRLERRHDSVVGVLVRPRRSHRRHLPRAQLADDLLPHFRVLGDLVPAIASSASPAVFVVLLWQATQY